jgi:hypothetical protein
LPHGGVKLLVKLVEHHRPGGSSTQDEELFHSLNQQVKRVASIGACLALTYPQR